MRTLRPYQREMVEYFHASHETLRCVPGVMATGGGKTEVFTDPGFLKPYLATGKRALIIAHSDELIEQAAKKARRNNPGRRIGIVKAALNQVTAEIVIASVQTMRNAKRREAVRNVGLVIIDECHHSAAASYRLVIDHYADAKVAGFTATFARGDTKKLSAVWEVPEGGIFSRDIMYFIRRGYLLDVRGHRVIVPDFDMSRVRQTAGDYRDGDLAEELERTFAPEIVAKSYAEVAAGRKGIAFWPLVETAYHGAKAFNDAGIRSEVIHGELPKVERRALLARLHSGETQVVHGVGVLTEGFDEPTCDVVVVARPTRSAPLYQQMVGRVLRPDLTKAPEAREKALILDVVGAGGRHDLRSLIDLAPERIPENFAEDGASLLQIEEEWVQQQGAAQEQAAEYAEDYRGETQIIEFDPLGRSQLWSRTPGGAWFMSAGTVAYAFLVESVAGDPGHYDVVLASKPQRGVTPWAKATEYVDLPLDMALGWAEEVAIEVGGPGTKTLTGRTAAWRKKPATECKPGFIGLGRSLGVYVDGMTAGELSAAIDAKQAANTIDPLVASVKRMAESG